jgi:hypothetical protein
LGLPNAQGLYFERDRNSFSRSCVSQGSFLSLPAFPTPRMLNRRIPRPSLMYRSMYPRHRFDDLFPHSVEGLTGLRLPPVLHPAQDRTLFRPSLHGNVPGPAVLPSFGCDKIFREDASGSDRVPEKTNSRVRPLLDRARVWTQIDRGEPTLLCGKRSGAAEAVDESDREAIVVLRGTKKMRLPIIELK